jgi:hypothetical protein
MTRAPLLLALAGLLAAAGAAAAAPKPICKGISGTPSNLACRAFTTREACLGTPGAVAYASSDGLQSQSCIWHALLPYSVVEESRLTNRGVQGIYSWTTLRGSSCGQRSTVTVPATALSAAPGGHWGVYQRLVGGLDFGSSSPGFYSFFAPSMGPCASGCAAGLNAAGALSCTTEMIALPGYAQTPYFNNITQFIQYQTSDPDRIALMNATAVPLDDAFDIQVELRNEWPRRCGVGAGGAPYPAGDGNTLAALQQTVSLSERVQFGPTAFAAETNGNGAKAEYQIISDRVYSISNSTAASWRVVTAPAPAAPGGAATGAPPAPMNVFLATESAYKSWQGSCNATLCAVPLELALPAAPVCTALECKGAAEGLDENELYVLWVAYDQIVLNKKNKEKSAPVAFPYASMMVEAALTMDFSGLPRPAANAGPAGGAQGQGAPFVGAAGV